MFEHDWFATPFVMMTCQVGLLMGRLTLTIAVRPLESLMSLTGMISSVSGVSHNSELVSKVTKMLDKCYNSVTVLNI